jgi:hypothetical protein
VHGDLCDKADRLEKPLYSLGLHKDGTLSGLLGCWLRLRFLCLKRLNGSSSPCRHGKDLRLPRIWC